MKQGDVSKNDHAYFLCMLQLLYIHFHYAPRPTVDLRNRGEAQRNHYKQKWSTLQRPPSFLKWASKDKECSCLRENEATRRSWPIVPVVRTFPGMGRPWNLWSVNALCHIQPWPVDINWTYSALISHSVGGSYTTYIVFTIQHIT